MAREEHLAHALLLAAHERHQVLAVHAVRDRQAVQGQEGGADIGQADQPLHAAPALDPAAVCRAQEQGHVQVRRGVSAGLDQQAALPEPHAVGARDHDSRPAQIASIVEHAEQPT